MHSKINARKGRPKARLDNEKQGNAKNDKCKTGQKQERVNARYGKYKAEQGRRKVMARKGKVKAG